MVVEENQLMQVLEGQCEDSGQDFVEAKGLDREVCVLGSSLNLNTNSPCDVGKITSPLGSPVLSSTKGQLLMGGVDSR